MVKRKGNIQMNNDSQTQSAKAVGSGGWLGTGIREPDGSVTCAKCGYECEWEECNACGGEGGHDGYEEDPNWYQPGEMTTCCQCGGTGGEWWCENRQCETQNITKILKNTGFVTASKQVPNDGADLPRI